MRAVPSIAYSPGRIPWAAEEVRVHPELVTSPDAVDVVSLCWRRLGDARSGLMHLRQSRAARSVLAGLVPPTDRDQTVTAAAVQVPRRAASRELRRDPVLPGGPGSSASQHS